MTQETQTRPAATGSEGRKRGPVPGPDKLRTTVYVEPDLVEWGKQQPGGLSELVRRLMYEERARQQERGTPAP